MKPNHDKHRTYPRWLVERVNHRTMWEALQTDLPLGHISSPARKYVKASDARARIALALRETIRQSVKGDQFWEDGTDGPKNEYGQTLRGTPLSYPCIGDLMGFMNHTSVIYAVKRLHRNRAASDEAADRTAMALHNTRKAVTT